MLDWLESAAGPDYAPALLWTAIALVALFVVLLIVRLIRNMSYGTFVAGGRNRKTRLAVMDATPIDSHRRLVLVRRDDVEHLILIGGSADVVVERDIRIAAQARRPHVDHQPMPRQGVVPPQRQQPDELQPPRTPPPTRLPPATPPVARAPEHAAANVQRNTAPARPQQAAPPPAANGTVDEIDEALMKELEVSLDEPYQPGETRPVPISLDEEMTKLLGELSNHKR